MRRFIVEVILDAVLLLFIILLLGIISVGQPFPFGPTSVPIVSLRGAGIIGFLSWAAVLVLVNRFARPILVALTGRLLFSTMGFFVVIINAVAIYITSFFAPIKIADVAQPTLLWVIVAAALYTALSTVMDAVLGLNRPDLGADRTRGIWGFLESLPTPRRNAILENLRLQQVYNAIYIDEPGYRPGRYADRAASAAGSRASSSATRTIWSTPPGRSGSWPCSSSSGRRT